MLLANSLSRVEDTGVTSTSLRSEKGAKLQSQREDSGTHVKPQTLLVAYSLLVKTSDINIGYVYTVQAHSYFILYIPTNQHQV